METLVTVTSASTSRRYESGEGGGDANVCTHQKHQRSSSFLFECFVFPVNFKLTGFCLVPLSTPIIVLLIVGPTKPFGMCAGFLPTMPSDLLPESTRK